MLHSKNSDKVILCGLSFFLFFGFLFLFYGCKKKNPAKVEEPLTTELTRGLPANPSKVNGYLFAGNIYSYGGTDWISNSFYAVFNDPATDLCKNYRHRWFDYTANDRGANVSVGSVFCNKTLIPVYAVDFKEIAYNIANRPPVSDSVSWSIEGNSSFQGFEQQFPNGLPEIKDTLAKKEITLGQGFVVELPGFIADYDSVIVTVKGQEPYSYKKGIAFPQNTISFSADELKPHTTLDDALISYYATKYYTRTIEGKVYVFELSKKVQVLTKINR